MPDHSLPFEVPAVTSARPCPDALRCGIAVARLKVPARLVAGLAVGVLIPAGLPVIGIAQTTQILSSATSSTTDPVTVSGQVINSATGAPVPRALVRLNARAMLTDHEGKFRFEQVTGLQVSQNAATMVNLQVTKPGFFQSSDPMDPMNQSYSLDQNKSPVVVRLYPEALITGTVTGPDGEPLAHVGVQARRSVYDEAGHRWMPLGNGQTNVHGDFRITVPAGDYRFEIRYVPRNAGGSEAVMPVSIPASSGGNTSELIHLRSGEEQHFDLRPAVRKTYAVPVNIESAGERGFPSITARASNGPSFNIGVTQNRGSGHGTISLPIGTYSLSARTQNQDGMEVAETRVTVTGAASEAETAGVTLRFVPIPAIPVELSIDPSATSDNTSGAGSYQAGSSQITVRTGGSSIQMPISSSTQNVPTAQQFGLMLQRVDQEDDDGMTMVGLAQRRDGPASFMAPPGTYRLAARGQNRWYIRSASFGTSDLISENLVVAAGTSSATIHLVVTNQTGSLQGAVKLNGQPVSSWVYLISTAPSFSPVITVHSNSSGTFSNPYLPPGTYRTVAFEHRHAGDFSDPAALDAYSMYVQSVTITAGNQSTLSLNAVPQTEVKP
jgi:hypothetical protein